MKLPSGIHIGTSGWNYDGWKGAFYPEKTTGPRMLDEYARHFGTVEVNGTFYSLPEADTVEDWTGRVPDDFIFSVKASRYITHMKKLKDPREPLGKLYRVLEAFGDRLGPVLFQLPPSWNRNPERLKQFLECLSRDYRYTFEFRDDSWHCEDVYELLAGHDAALCFYDYEERQSPEKMTTDFAYIRLHGPEAQAYQGSYSDDAMEEWARKILNWRKSGQSVFCYFDNDEKARAPGDARRLRDLIRAMDT
ncbi:MAG: DUF72 domain-containing protein [Puniceicoccaceae bacterium]